MSGLSVIESGADAAPSSSPYTPNFAHVLLERAAQQGQQRAFTFLEDGETRERCISYGELELRARSIGGRLRETAEVGARALLLYPAGLDFIEAFFGCLFAGLVPVPLYPPRRNEHAERVRSVAVDAGASLVLGCSETLAGLQLGAPDTLPRLRSLATTEIESVAAGGSDPVPLRADAIALLQYTSGATGQAKGVRISHGNLLANVVTIASVSRPSASSGVVSWLPMWRGIGLVGSLLYPLFMGVPALLMSPSHFLERPLRWLSAISRYRATESPAPNFAYELCIQAAQNGDLSGLDLSRWQLAWNGGEPVRADTLERFTATFAPAGFQHTTHYPCFGVTEATLLLCGGERGAGASVRDLDIAALEQGRATDVGAAPRRRLVSSGKPLGGELAIVNPKTRRRAAPDEVGEIWFSGRNVAHGYWNRPDASAETFGAQLLDDSVLEDPTRRYLRTGDLGFVSAGGELFVTGRLEAQGVAGRARGPLP
ncbi:MAG: fatty acyl-AMP ligase [Deltaproteobacteria bacterium]